MKSKQHSQLLKKLFCHTAMFVSLLGVNGITFAAKQEKDQPPAGQIQPLDGEARDQAAQLVRQLANPKFELRQQSSRELWKIGPPVLELLETAVEGGLNSEARLRAKDLTTLIKVGLEHDADADVVRCVVGFLDREPIVQDRAIQKLCYLQQVDVALKLIELVESDNERTRLRQFCSMAASDAIELSLRMGDYQEFERLINDPTARETQKLLYYYYLWVEDKLEPELVRLKGEAKIEIAKAADHKAKLDKETSKKKAAKNSKSAEKAEVAAPDQSKLKTLIGLLRFLERWDESLEFADKVYDRAQRRKLTHSILMESGNWTGLAGLIVEPESDDGDDVDEEDVKFNGLAYSAEGYRKALIEYYAGDEERYEATIAKIEKGIEDEARKQKQRGNEPTEGDSTHANFLRYTLDYDRALKYQPLKKTPATFQTLSSAKRYDRLFEFFKLETFEKRAKYFKGRSRRIRSLQKRVDYYVEQEDSGQQETYADKLSSEIQNWQNVVALLATLGFDEEAELYYRQMFFEFSRNGSSVSHNAISSLQDMGAYASAWEIAEIESNRVRDFDCRNALLNPSGYQHDVAEFLDLELTKKIEDRMERYRKIAALTKSPADLSKEKIDFWQEVATLDLSKNLASVQHLFLIWNLDEEKLFHHTGSLEGVEKVERLVKDGKFLTAAQKYEAMALNDSSPLNYAKAWNAYAKHGDANKAKHMRLLFVKKFDPEDAYDYTSGYVGTQWQSLPFDAYRLHDCFERTDVGSSSYYMWRIASGDTEAVLSAHQKMVRTQILRLRYISSPYLDQSEKDHPRFIEGALESGDVEAARRWFRKQASFQPADSGFVEENFPSFEKMGNKEFVDEMFQEVSNGFYKILKSYPDSAMYLNNYAWACACAKRNVKNGIELSKRAVELRPGTAGYFDTLAELYHIDGQNDMAIKTIRRAIEINPMRDYYTDQLKKFKEAAAVGDGE